MKEQKSPRSQVNLAEVAAAAGVSKMTASRVLRGATGFSEETGLRVLEEVRRLGYVANKVASTFSSEAQSTLVGVSLPLLATEGFTQILDGMERSLAKHGYQPLLGVSAASGAAEEQWLEAVLAWRPAGLILMGRDRTKRSLDLIDNAAVPVIELWDLNTRPIDVCIGLSHFDAGYEMGRRLAGSAHRRIGYVGARSDLAGLGMARLEGLRQAIADSGRPPVVEYLINEPSSFYAGLYGCEHLIAHDPDLDLVCFQDDDMALGGIMWCQARGMRSPEDIGIVGWGGLPAAAVLPRKLTTMQVNRLKLGRLAAESMLQRIAGVAVDKVQDVSFQFIPGATVRWRG